MRTGRARQTGSGPRRRSVVLAAAVVLTGGCRPARGPFQLIVENADVLDVRTGSVLPDRTITINEGRIVAVLPPSAGHPEAERVVDAAGRLVIPGLVDAHSHLAYLLGDSLSTGGGLITHLSRHPDSLSAYRRRYAEQYLPYGVTTVRDAGSSAQDVALLVDWMDAGPDLPDIHPTGGALVSYEEGRTPFPGHHVVRDPEDAAATVRAYHAMGLRHVKLYWRLREPDFRAALNEARRLKMNVTGHVDFQVMDVDRALDLGLRSFEHAYTVGVSALGPDDYLAAWREHLPRWIGDRQDGRFYLGVMEYFSLLGPDDPRMERLISRLAQTGSVVVPTLHLFAQRLGLAPYGAPPLGSFDDLSGLTPDQLEHARRGYRILADQVRRMHEAGVRLAVGTDWVDPGKATLSEIWLLNRAGIPMTDALRIATLGGAEALAVGDDVGAIEPGMKAHLVILEGDPLSDPDAILGPRTVIKDGVVVEESGAAVGVPTSAAPAPDAPRLVVLLAVDQLGEELLERVAPHLEGGLGRLLREGRWFVNGWVDHAVTVSHPGHVTLSTGLDPADHGIVDAAFYVPGDNGRVFTDAVRDSTETILGGGDAPGVSPRRILAPGLWEWMAAADARRVAVGTGRYASLLYARSAGDVYWFEPGVPGFVTSSFYRSRYPDWVEAFNHDALPGFMADTVWTLSVPGPLQRLARIDSAAYESGGLHPAFPHRLHDETRADRRGNASARASWFADTPTVDAATLALARSAVEARELGQRDATDLLVVVLSAVDAIGHWYGPRSLEQLDNLMRLDRELGRFLAFLDSVVGPRRYVLALSADHAAPPAPEQRRAEGLVAERIGGGQMEEALAAARRAAAGAGLDPAARARAVAAALEAFPWVADAMTPEELLWSAPADSFVALYRRSYRADRVPRYPLFSFKDGTSDVAREGVAVRLRPEAMPDLDVSVHGSPYAYDRRVPLVFFGAGVSPGRSGERVTTRDVAPTLAALASVPVPSLPNAVVLHVRGTASEP